MVDSYDNQCFMSGIVVGRQLKGWANGAGGGSSGSLDITVNGTYDVSQYAQAVVNVRQETVNSIPYECLMLDEEVMVITIADLVYSSSPYITGNIPYEVLMLDEEIMLVTEADIIRV